MNVDAAQVKPLSTQLGDSSEDSAMLFQMAQEAKRFIESFEWCSGVKEQFFGEGVGGVLALRSQANPLMASYLVSVPATPEWGENLERRLAYIEQNFLKR